MNGMRILTGVAFIITGVVCFALFKAFFVNPTHLPAPNGELYGPVSFFRIPIYLLCAANVLIGILIVAAFWSPLR